MNHIPKIYCQLSFIEKFLDTAKDSILELLIANTQKVDCTSSCYKLIYGSAEIFIDVSENDLKNHPNPMIKKLIKKESSNIFCRPSLKEEIKTDEFWSKKTFELFMLDVKREYADKIEQNWGVMVLTAEKLVDKYNFLVPSSPIFLKKGNKEFKWQNISFAKHYFHSIIIIDNYIKNSSKSNLVPLLISICKGNLVKRKIHVTIVTTCDLDNLKESLSDELIKNQLEVKVRVVKSTKDDNHDRHIISNSFWIHSGLGFDLIENDKIKKDTTLLIMPLFSNEIIKNDNVQNELSTINTCFNSGMSLLCKMSKIDFEKPDNIENQITAKGEKNLFYRDYFDFK